MISGTGGRDQARATTARAHLEPHVTGEAPDPVHGPTGVVLRVEANGVCHSDHHGWTGDDPYPSLPHVPGHEMVGTVAAVGSEVRRWRVGDRVNYPFSVGSGVCGLSWMGWTIVTDVNIKHSCIL